MCAHRVCASVNISESSDIFGNEYSRFGGKSLRCEVLLGAEIRMFDHFEISVFKLQRYGDYSKNIVLDILLVLRKFVSLWILGQFESSS